MKNTAQLQGKKIAVIGLARSGLASAELLHRAGAMVWVSESRDDALTRASAQVLEDKGMRVEVGGHTPLFIEGKDMVVVSPGVPDTAPPVLWARTAGIPLVSEIEVAWQLCPATVIAITGSTGKTTVTTLIGMALRAAGKKVFVCGNIGTPFSSQVPEMSAEDFVALEVSSFQLEKIISFRPHIAVLLNLNKNHLDRHKDMQEYLAAKQRIFMNQGPAQYLVVNSRDEALCLAATQARASMVYFEGAGRDNPNQAAVRQVAHLVGISDAVCDEVFAAFTGIEHRNEFVAEIRGVRFINDSKATVAESTVWALSAIPGKVILIAGGKDKGVDYSVILPAAKDKVKEVVLIGEAAPVLRKAFAGHLVMSQAANLEDAVRRAFQGAQPGDTVILSPMCASFDMFLNYEHRGRVFKETVFSLR